MIAFLNEKRRTVLDTVRLGNYRSQNKPYATRCYFIPKSANFYKLMKFTNLLDKISNGSHIVLPRRGC